MKKDGQMWRKLRRRMESGRASVYFEFALIAPLAVMLVLFAADFCRILHAEQQLEIASRLLADLEGHYSKDSDKEDSPYQKCKQAVRGYLSESLGVKEEWVFCNAKTEYVPGALKPLAQAMDWLENPPIDGWGGGILRAIVSGAVNIVTGGTHKYIVDFCRSDEMVGTAVCVKMKSLFPKVQGWAGAHFAGVAGEWSGYLMIEPVEEVLEKNGNYKNPRERRVHRHWMPVLNTLCVPRETYIRKFEKNIRKSVIAKIIRKIGGDANDYWKTYIK